MKKIATLIAMLGAAAIAFTSCEGTDGTATATIKKIAITEETDKFVGNFDVTCPDTDAIKEVTATYTYGTTTVSVPVADVEKAEINKSSWKVTVSTPIEVDGKRVSKMEVTATLKGTKGSTKSEIFETPKATEPEPGETALGAATAFEFKRVGTTVSGDLSKFGLEWKSNTRAVNANITKGTATKMVKLASDAWTVITTKEALKTAVDAAADMDKFSEISADATKTYNINLGVVNGGVYYIINITNGKVTTGTAGTTIDVTGNYKN